MPAPRGSSSPPGREKGLRRDLPPPLAHMVAEESKSRKNRGGGEVRQRKLEADLRYDSLLSQLGVYAVVWLKKMNITHGLQRDPYRGCIQ